MQKAEQLLVIKKRKKICSATKGFNIPLFGVAAVLSLNRAGLRCCCGGRGEALGKQNAAAAGAGLRKKEKRAAKKREEAKEATTKSSTPSDSRRWGNKTDRPKTADQNKGSHTHIPCICTYTSIHGVDA